MARARSGSECWTTTSSNVRFMSSIIACSEPPADRSIPATSRGVLSSSVRPMDWARRRAGSMVRTTAVRPRSAARTPRAAAVVVLPTPPEPQQTMMRVLRSSSSGSMSSTGLSRLISLLSVRVVVRVAVAVRVVVRFRGGRHHRLLAQALGEPVEPAEVHTVAEQLQLPYGQAELGDLGALLALQHHALGVLMGLGEQRVDETFRHPAAAGAAEPGLGQRLGDGGAALGGGAVALRRG